jgi:hypothetical protein
VEELREDCASDKLSRASQAGGQAAATREEQPGFMQTLFGSAAARPYRLWKLLHIGMCLRCALLVYLAWWFKERDKRKVERGAVLLDFALQHDSIHNGRRVTLRGEYGHGIPP